VISQFISGTDDGELSKTNCIRHSIADFTEKRTNNLNYKKQCFIARSGHFYPNSRSQRKFIFSEWSLPHQKLPALQCLEKSTGVIKATNFLDAMPN
jgi:hypothetical protein